MSIYIIIYEHLYYYRYLLLVSHMRLFFVEPLHFLESF